MKNLLLMRHAKSSWKDTSLPNHQRPLKQRGKTDALRIGELLRKQGVIIDVILCSTAKRAMATAKGFLKKYTFEGDIFHIDDLYNASHETFITLLNQLPDTAKTAMIIGHNPEMDYFLEVICNEYEHMTTATVAHIELPVEQWIELNGVSPGRLISLSKPHRV